VPTILIADDNPHTRRMGNQILTEEGYQVWLASDSDEALDQAVQHRPDLAIFGTRMNGLSGIELCRLVKGDPELGQMRVVLLAGPRESLTTRETSLVSADGILWKPLDSDLVLRTIRNLLDQEIMSPVSSSEVVPLDTTKDSANDARFTSSPLERKDHSKINLPPIFESYVAISGTVRRPSATPEKELVGEAAEVVLEKTPPMDAEKLRAAVASAVEAVVPEIIDHVTKHILKTTRER
jgi:CheY-like chemotaxis protein